VIPAVPPHGTLRHGRDIARTLRASRQCAGRFVVLHAFVRDDVDVARIAVVASRRVGGAVARNRAKRLLREAVRHLPIRPGMDVVLVARAASARSGLAEVHEELARLATQLDVLVTEEARR
jgi:ribonuclease P protein component